MAYAPSEQRRVSHWLATLVFVWFGCVVYIALEQISGLLTVRDFDTSPWRRIHTVTLYYWLPWVLLAPLVAALSQRVPIRPDRWLWPLLAHLALLLCLSLAHGLAMGYQYYFSAHLTPYMAGFAPWQHSGHFLFGDDLFLFDVIFYAVFAATFNIRNFQQIVRQQELDASRLNARLSELRFQTLRMQINPHFLFNALNAISVLVKKRETAKAVEMIARLSRFFRRTLDGSSEHWVTLEDELEMVRQYLGIAQLRFGDRLRVRDRCDPAAQRGLVPTLLLQPLVENAVVHGLGDKLGDCELSLSCRRDGDRLHIDIEDNGVGAPSSVEEGLVEGVGLTNVKERLEQMYDGEHEFVFHSTPGRGTRIGIAVPFREALDLRAAG
jgi:signal transduction histidine kinase